MGLIGPHNSEPPLPPLPPPPTTTTTPTRNVLRSGEANKGAVRGMAGHGAMDVRFLWVRMLAEEVRFM